MLCTKLIAGTMPTTRISSTSSSYATARTGGTLATSSTARLGQYLSGSNYVCYESFVEFDTSSLPDNATACPGRYFPMDALLGAAPAPAPAAKHIAKSLRPVLKQRMLWYAADHGVPLTDARVAVVDASGSPSTGWGASAQRLAQRVSAALPGVKRTKQPTTELFRALK